MRNLLVGSPQVSAHNTMKTALAESRAPTTEEKALMAEAAAAALQTVATASPASPAKPVAAAAAAQAASGGGEGAGAEEGEEKTAPPMTLEGYRLQCCHELFPSVPRAECAAALAQARGLIGQHPAQLAALHKRAGTSNVDPVGYVAVDLLLDSHPTLLVKRKGCSLHHPFD